jgi:hypothetical protein
MVYAVITQSVTAAALIASSGPTNRVAHARAGAVRSLFSSDSLSGITRDRQKLPSQLDRVGAGLVSVFLPVRVDTLGQLGPQQLTEGGDAGKRHDPGRQSSARRTLALWFCNVFSRLPAVA